MRWQIAQFVFCDKQQTLTSGSETQQLEPLMVELLSYFCRNQGRIVSKQQLIDEVWLGRIVTDNAVSRLITKLRKVFDDDVRQPRFIATFPKKGYKFIADVAVIAEPDAAAIPAQTDIQAKTHDKPFDTVKTQRRPYYLALAAIVIIAFTVLGLVWKNDSETSASYAKAFTTDAGNEVLPGFSPDGSRVAFMSIKDNKLRLMIRQLEDGRTAEISHGESLGVGPADWSKDGQSIVYLVATADRCEYYMRSVNGMTFGEPKLIHTCPRGSYGKILFTHDPNILVYTENIGGNSPYSIYTLNVETGEKRRVNQPALYLGGNSQFDLHPIENRLLISSPDRQQWEGFYALDLDTDVLTLLFSQDTYTCCGIWNHQGDRVVLMGSHPAYQLVSYALDGTDDTVIYSGSRHLRSPRRHINGVDYVFSSQESNTNFAAFDLGSKEQGLIVDDSVDELLARFAHHSDNTAYISFASGSENIWVASQSSTSKRQVTQFNDGRHYVDLLWSPDDTYLAALTINEIHLVNAESGKTQILNIEQQEIRGVSFKSKDTISFSIREGERWRVYNYDLMQQNLLPGNDKWQFIQYRHDSDNALWLDVDGQLYTGQLPKRVESSLIPREHLFNGRQFNLRKQGPDWFWYDRNNAEIKRLHEPSATTTSLVKTDIDHFDIKGPSLLYGVRERADSNLYQTQQYH